MTIARLAKSLLMAGVMTITAGTPGRSEPIDVRFTPPDVALPKAPICSAPVRDEDMIADWTAWDRKKLPKREVYTITRDMNRLRDVDARRFEPIITRVQELLPTVKPSYGEKDALFDKVKLMIAMGQSDQVSKDGLVQKLLDMGGHPAGSLNTLADLLIDGKGIAADRKAGLKLKVEAAYGGNSDAILDLARMSKDGEQIEGWQIEPELAVNMAFGTLVGVLDEGICDRIGRVAREYDGGEIVVQDPSLSLAWYRFAADLGDTTAAWKVAEYNLLSEKVVKDNDVLVKYLKMAADGGNMSAILEMGRLYAEGALVPQDRKKAFAYFQAAEKQGNQAGLIKQAQLLEQTKDTSPKDAAAYEELLHKLIDRDDPPAWAFTRLARVIQARDGLWKSASAVRPLLEEAVKRGDIEGGIDLAELLVRTDLKPATIARSADLLTNATHINGDINAIAKLQRVYLCVDPAGPDFASADYWANIEAGAGNKTLDLAPDQIDQLPALKDPLVIAAIQTQALYGRASALALYQRYLKGAGYSDQVLKFWAERAEVRRGATVEAALLEFKQNLEKGQVNEARRTIQMSGEGMTVDAGLSFARFLVKNYSNDAESMELAREILAPLAESGSGRAVKLLEEVSGSDLNPLSSPLDNYAEIMRDRGDMAAQLLLAENAKSDADRKLYYDRAISTQRCDYDDSMALAEFALRHEPEDTQHWLNIASHIAGDDSWRKVKIGDMYMALKTPETENTALKLYAEAREGGEAAAFYRLVKHYADNTGKAYDPNKASDIFVDLVARSEPETVTDKLVMLSNMKPEIRRIVSQRIDIKDLYRKSAELGQPVAMRELAKILRDDPKDSKAVFASFDWLKKAAEAGDGEAMFLLSQAYAYGSGTKPALDAAQHWMAKAAEAGYPQAAYVLKLNKSGTEG
ncbi:tetratricopeptide repeat protein [Rhizobium glycinendophyticum]|uniref:Sel1 repeat family protein n=1 Tax=Rhizobium glycinendophyticum TaxID=2589807 RepID=A0A504UMV4_9HYPH|nr:tetratricopeptide repeat protein [Rhizobium glycinendophyticum]TPP06752.1 sel1 repeat family protein [Rhizobium glycinendophyticum]